MAPMARGNPATGRSSPCSSLRLAWSLALHVSASEWNRAPVKRLAARASTPCRAIHLAPRAARRERRARGRAAPRRAGTWLPLGLRSSGRGAGMWSRDSYVRPVHMRRESYASDSYGAWLGRDLCAVDICA